MTLKEIIERAEKAVGSQKTLGKILGQAPSTIRAAKAGICGLPTYACVIIAELIGENEITVIAASELNTEKKENRRAIWEKKLENIAASAMITIVTTIMTPTLYQATELTQVNNSMYIMSNRFSILYSNG